MQLTSLFTVLPTVHWSLQVQSTNQLFAFYKSLLLNVIENFNNWINGITCLWCVSSNTSKDECTTKLTITNAHYEIKYLMLTDIGHGKQDYSNVTMNDRPTCTCTCMYTCEMSMVLPVVLLLFYSNTPFILSKNAAQPPEDVPCLPLVHCRYKRSQDKG